MRVCNSRSKSPTNTAPESGRPIVGCQHTCMGADVATCGPDGCVDGAVCQLVFRCSNLDPISALSPCMRMHACARMHGNLAETPLTSEHELAGIGLSRCNRMTKIAPRSEHRYIWAKMFCKNGPKIGTTGSRRKSFAKIASRSEQRAEGLSFGKIADEQALGR